LYVTDNKQNFGASAGGYVSSNKVIYTHTLKSELPTPYGHRYGYYYYYYYYPWYLLYAGYLHLYSGDKPYP